MYKYYGAELYHYGVAGRSGRYPWGSGGRPYQRLEKPTRRVGIIKRIQTRKLEKQRVEKEASEKERIKRQQRKEEILGKGSAAEVLNYKKEFGLSNQEMTEALTRIRLTDELRKYADKDIKTGWDVMNATAKRMKDINFFTSVGIVGYKNLDTIMKIIDEGSKKAEKEKTKGS